MPLIRINDTAYTLLLEYMHKHKLESFSDAIINLVQTAENHNTQVNKIINLLSRVLQKLEGIETQIKKLPKETKTVEREGEEESRVEVREEELPSYLRDNPWLEILASSKNA